MGNKHCLLTLLSSPSFRLNYTDGEYLDAEDVTVSTTDFGKLSSSADLVDLIPPDIDVINFVDYFLERGYTADKNIRAAPYDWRLGGGINMHDVQFYRA